MAQLCIAATAVPRKQRGVWLRRVALRIETGKPAGDAVADPAAEAKRRAKRKAARLRQRLRRRRAKALFRMARVPIGPHEEQLLRDTACLQDWDEADDADVLGNAVRILFAQLLAKAT